MSEVLHGRGLFPAVAIDFASRCMNSGLPVFLVEPRARRLVADDAFRRGVSVEPRPLRRRDVGHRALTALSQHSLRRVHTLTRAIPPFKQSGAARPRHLRSPIHELEWNRSASLMTEFPPRPPVRRIGEGFKRRRTAALDGSGRELETGSNAWRPPGPGATVLWRSSGRHAGGPGGIVNTLPWTPWVPRC
jgi:hypothetical protein